MDVNEFVDLIVITMMDSSSADYRGAVAAAQAFVTAPCKEDGTSLKNWMEHSGTHLSEFLEVFILCCYGWGSI